MLLLLISCYFLGNLASIGSPAIFVYGLFIMVGIYSMAELADLSPGAIGWAAAYTAFGFALLYWKGGWFGLDALLPYGSALMGGYLVFSLLMAVLLRPTQAYQKSTTPTKG